MDVERVVADLADRFDRQYFGKYRGIVVDNNDPERLGRLRMIVPSVLGSDVVSGWAKACLPYGGAPEQGFVYIPSRGAGVWVEFEEGDLEFPIWTGAFVSKPNGRPEVPTPITDGGLGSNRPEATSDVKIIKTAAGHVLQFDDRHGEEAVQLCDGAHGHRFTFDAEGITITDGIHGHVITLTDNHVTVSTGGAVAGNSLEMDASGITVSDKNGNTIELRADGIHLGGAIEKMVLGTSLAANVATFLSGLATHTHVGNLGAPTSPPVVPMTLQVPLSTRNSVG
ncbi:MAG: phage tail protein [Pseudonocardia sp.]|nr:MAG: phage tail protein [Pseudonocardia sp.]